MNNLENICKLWRAPHVGKQLNSLNSMHNIFRECQTSLLNLKPLNNLFVGKYPHLLVSAAGCNPQASDSLTMESVVSFGAAQIGSTVQRVLQLYNLSPVSM